MNTIEITIPFLTLDGLSFILSIAAIGFVITAFGAIRGWWRWRMPVSIATIVIGVLMLLVFFGSLADSLIGG